MVNTTTIECVVLCYVASEKSDGYVGKDNSRRAVDGKSLTLKGLTRTVM